MVVLFHAVQDSLAGREINDTFSAYRVRDSSTLSRVFSFCFDGQRVTAEYIQAAFSEGLLVEFSPFGRRRNRVEHASIGNSCFGVVGDELVSVCGLWMAQVARNLSDNVERFLMGKQYLIHDRDPLYTAEFLGTLGAAGVKSVKLPPRSPNLNAHAERFVRTIKESCLERVILFGEGSLRKAIHEFIAHYHLERNRQGLGNRLISPKEPHIIGTGGIRRRQRLGGMLNYYYRQAA